MNCPFTGTSCLPGLQVKPPWVKQVCGQTGEVPSFCQACPGSPHEASSLQCALWGAGRIAWGAPELAAPGPSAASLCNGSRISVVAPRFNAGCARSVPLRSEALDLLGSQTVMFIGDSLMRQVFTRTVAWMRGQSTLADPAFHSDALYLANEESDAFVPLMLGYTAECALELVEGKEQSADCSRRLREELRETGGPFKREKAFVKARHDLWKFSEPVLRSPIWRVGRRITLVFVWRPWYTTTFVGPISRFPVHVVVAGAIGTHVPCWSDGRAGGKCPIETVTEAAHRKFWSAVHSKLQSTPSLRLFAWLGVPFGHTGGRYINGNYSGFNERARRELLTMGRTLSGMHVRVVDYPGLVKRPGLFRSGVLARRDDNTHFQCITKGRWFYPMTAITDAKTHKLLMVGPDGRPTPTGGQVTCMEKVCQPHVDEGCTDPVNLALVRVLMMLIATRARRDRQQSKRGCAQER